MKGSTPNHRQTAAFLLKTQIYKEALPSLRTRELLGGELESTLSLPQKSRDPVRNALVTLLHLHLLEGNNLDSSQVPPGPCRKKAWGVALRSGSLWKGMRAPGHSGISTPGFKDLCNPPGKAPQTLGSV